MGCAASCLDHTTMSLFGRHSHNDNDERAQVERKLYIAKESPEPVFDLSKCNLQEVPSGIYSICKVYRKELLYLNNNNLSSLDHGGSLSDLYMIKCFNISFNKLSFLPNDIRYLVNVTELYLQNNQLQSIPESVSYLQCLKIIDASNNCLKKLCSALGNLANLKVLKITGNKDLVELPCELCKASNITAIELDADQYLFPPPGIITEGTESIMRFMCEKMGVPYIPPSNESNDESLVQSPSALIDPFTKNHAILWEQQEAALKEQEKKFHDAAKLNKEKILSQVLREQTELDAEIAKWQGAKDIERLRLISEIQEDEKEIECLVRNFIQSVNLKPEVVQQQLQHEQAEHDRLFEIIRQNYDNVRKADVLKAMETLITENFSMENTKRGNEDQLNNFKQTILSQELESTEKLDQLYRTKDQSRTVLIHQLLEDQDVQKAVVASLVEKVDARSWSLNQEISLISSNLARLSAIEQEKKKLHVAYNFNELLYQRTQLLSLLEDLQAQHHKRRAQLLETMREMDEQKDSSTDFWLKNYQKVVESAPKSLLVMGKVLDPVLANYLLQEGVIYCLPFLFQFLFSDESLLHVTPAKLKQNGVSLAVDRDGIIRAIQLYIAAKSENHNCLSDTTVTPSAPLPSEISENSLTGVVDSSTAEGQSVESECVICMDARCEVVFVPCGHLCCCLPCSDKEMDSCPMCRGSIERKMKLIVV